MKKMKIYNYGWIAAFALLLAGCDNFLGHDPDDRLKISTLDRVAQTVTGAYNEYGVRFTDLSSDNVGLADGVYGTEPVLEDLYAWRRDFREQEHQDSPGAYWRNAYAGIANINIALQALDRLQLEESEKSRAAAIRGEALVLRSYYHFMLVNLFSPHYDPITAKNDLGVPYVTTVEDKLVQHYDRASVEEVYRLAEEDMLAGIRLLEDNRGEFVTNKYHFTFPTVYLYASRFYLFRNRDEKDVEAAVDFSEKAITAFGGVGVMRTWLEYATDTYGPTDVNQQEVGMVQRSSTWSMLQYAYQLTLQIKNRYFQNPFGLEDTRQVIVFKSSGDIFIPAFYYVITPDGSSTATDIFPFSEALLNAAEAYTRQGNYTKALDLLRELGARVYRDYKPRNLTLKLLANFYGYFDEVGSEAAALTDYILYERRLQFLFHGMRWFDMRRYELDAEHKLINGEVLILSDVNPDRNYQIPRFAIEAGMTPNK